MEGSERVVGYPNRERAESKATRLAVVVLLVLSAVLSLVMAVGGAAVLSSGPMILFVFGLIALYLVMAFYVLRWSRGVLALAAATAVMWAVLTAVSIQSWFARDQSGFAEPLIPTSVLGLIAVVIVPVQLLLVAFAMRGFNQSWNIEVYVTEEEAQSGLADKFDEGGRRVKGEDPDG